MLNALWNQRGFLDWQNKRTVVSIWRDLKGELSIKESGKLTVFTENRFNLVNWRLENCKHNMDLDHHQVMETAHMQQTEQYFHSCPPN